MNQAESQPDPSPVVPFSHPIRTFEIVFVGGAKELQTAHAYDDSSLHLVFIDFVQVSERTFVRYHRRTVAAGQWRDVREVGQAPTEPTAIVH